MSVTVPAGVTRPVAAGARRVRETREIEMTEFDIRGGCENMPLEMTGEWTGYNTGATMQIGLWIRNDGEYIEGARTVALLGPQALSEHLRAVMARAPKGSAPRLAFEAARTGMWRELPPTIDWAQITYDLVGSEPDDDDLAAARADLLADGQAQVTDDEVWKLAVQRREALARLIALGGAK